MKFFSLKIGILLLLLSFTANAQTTETKENEWVTIETENKELSISIPNNFSFFFDKEGYKTQRNANRRKNLEYKNLRNVIAYQNGVTMWLKSYDVKNGKDYFPEYLANESFDGLSLKAYKIEKYLFVIGTQETDHTVNRYFLHSDKRVYSIGFGARDKYTPEANKFLKMIKFKGEYLFKANEGDNEKIVEPSKSLIYENMTTTHSEIINEKKKKEKEQTTKTFVDKSKSVTDSKEQIEGNSNSITKTVKMILLTKPKPGYTESARKSNVKGHVNLKVAFGRDGLIQSVEVIKGLKYGLTEKAVNAARQIAFIPPLINGKPFSTRRTIIYNFDIY